MPQTGIPRAELIEKGDGTLEHTYLTQDEVNKLPAGTPVMVQWSGEIGPHRYTVVRLGDNKARVSTIEKEALLNVGQDRWNTKVWLPEGDE